MADLGVPCPACGSLLVLVSPQAVDRPPSAAALAGRGHIPQWHDCSCRECCHAFRHDFAFAR